MIYDHKLLNNQESVSVLALVEHYKGYDKLDILIELAVLNPAGVLKRKNNKKEEVKIKERMPQEVMFCTTDSCEVDYTRKGC